ncbi:MAG TPA: alpha/beta hydrolase [Solirubrobacterales bacterium]|nr:alpha/beta hydrolase [Solirubrobacterales bacterium]
MFENTSGTFTGHDGGEIFWQRWSSGRVPTAAVVIAHGVSEHSGRYAHVAARLNDGGYDVWALDHRGHGRSDGGSANIGRIATAVADIGTAVGMARAEAPDGKAFLLGHSMGGALALDFALDRQDELAGLVLSAPATDLEAASRLELLAGRVLSAVSPNAGVFDVDPDSVSRDPQVVRDYVSDPLNHHEKLPARTVSELARVIGGFPARLPGLTLPLLVMVGTADRLVPPAASYMVHELAGSADKRLVTYKGLFHEIMNEPEQERVMNDLVAWLDDRAAAA